MSSRPGEIIAPGSVACVAFFVDSRFRAGEMRGVRDEGMPKNKNASIKGTLYIEFAVEFPKDPFTDEEVKVRSVISHGFRAAQHKLSTRR